MENEMVVINISEAEKLAFKALRNNGVNEEPARAIIRAYIEAEKCGKPSHGLKLVPWVLQQLKKTNPQVPLVISEKDNALLMDGAENPGPYVAEQLVGKLLEITDRTTMAIGGIRNAGHIGVLSHYAKMFTDKNRIAFIFATTPSVTVPFNGKEPVLGTNPFCIAVPSEGNPIILDASTTAITYHSLLKAKDTGEALPENVVLDTEGNATQSPDKADPTKILTFGGHKGFGISLMVELLTGAFTGWKVGAEKAKNIENDRFSSTMIVLRADTFIGESLFFGGVEKLKQDIANSQGKDIPHLPFTNSAIAKAKAESSGTIEVPQTVIDTLKALSV